jgi:hypothetical protein
VNDFEENDSKPDQSEPQVLVFDFNHCGVHMVLASVVAVHAFRRSRL